MTCPDVPSLTLERLQVCFLLSCTFLSPSFWLLMCMTFPPHTIQFSSSMTHRVTSLAAQRDGDTQRRGHKEKPPGPERIEAGTHRVGPIVQSLFHSVVRSYNYSTPRASYNSLVLKSLEEDLCWIDPRVSLTTQSVKVDWTERLVHPGCVTVCVTFQCFRVCDSAGQCGGRMWLCVCVCSKRLAVNFFFFLSQVLNLFFTILPKDYVTNAGAVRGGCSKRNYSLSHIARLWEHINSLMSQQVPSLEWKAANHRLLYKLWQGQRSALASCGSLRGSGQARVLGTERSKYPTMATLKKVCVVGSGNWYVALFFSFYLLLLVFHCICMFMVAFLPTFHRLISGIVDQFVNEHSCAVRWSRFQ